MAHRGRSFLQQARARIFWYAARLRRIRGMLGGPPVGGPLPDIADHVVDAVAVRRKRRHRRGALLGWNFGKGDVPSGADEFLELTVGHWRLINPEATDGDAMNRRLFGIMSIRSHAEGAARDEDHLGCTFAIHRSSFRKFLVLEGACFVRVAAMDLRSIKDT